MNPSEEYPNESHVNEYIPGTPDGCGDDGEIPDKLLSAAKELLDQLQQSDYDLQGLADLNSEDPQPDLYTLLEGFTALRQEISLQGRTFHELQQHLNHHLEQNQSQMAWMKTNTAQVQSQVQAQAKEAAFAEGYREALHQLLDPLLDTHDQFRRMNDQFHSRLRSRQSWFGFFRNTKELKQVQLSVALTLKKLDQRLQSMQIVPIARVGGPFEAQEMKAVELKPTASIQPNHVAEIFRQGYRHEDRILRFAEVKVSSRDE